MVVGRKSQKSCQQIYFGGEADKCFLILTHKPLEDYSMSVQIEQFKQPYH